jgi:rhodanese-related sulfurtransferase
MIARGLLLTLLALAGCRGDIRGDEARVLVGRGALLVDVRSPGEYSAGHLDGAVNLPVGEIANRLTELPRDRSVIVYCRSGVRSARAARTLRAAGFTVRNLGGMSEW